VLKIIVDTRPTTPQANPIPKPTMPIAVWHSKPQAAAMAAVVLRVFQNVVACENKLGGFGREELKVKVGGWVPKRNKNNGEAESAGRHSFTTATA
jgi:hypothetical protein